MSEPGLLSPAIAAARPESLWDKAPGWRTLVMVASCLTLAAVATPLMLPGSGEAGLSSQAVPAHVAAAPAHTAAPKLAIAQPVNPVPERTASLAPYAAAPAIPQPASVGHHTTAPLSNTPVPTTQPEPAQPTAGASNTAAPAPTTAPAPDLSNLPVGTQIVSSGVLSQVNRHNRFNSSLGGDLPVSITIISGPAHGTVSTKTGTAMLTFQGVGTRVSTVTDVFYQSAPGYTGQDSFTYKRTSSDPNDPRNANTYTVNIYAK